MQNVMTAYRGMTLLLSINLDRVFTLGTIIVGLLAGAFLGSTLLELPR